MDQVKPVLNDFNLATKIRWQDEFDGDLSKWHQDDFLGKTPHKTGSKYLTNDGAHDPKQNWTAAPVRHAARYDEFRDVVHRIESNQLLMVAVVVKERNELRENFTDKSGVVHRYGDHKIYLPWLSTSLYMNKPVDDGLISDPSTLLGTAKPGTVSEVRVNLTKQVIRNMRWNFWLMSTTGKDYDKNVAEVEIDTPEAQYSVRTNKFGNSVLMKVVGGEAGDTPNGEIDLASFGINLREGWHTFTLVWNHDGTLEFYIDGILVNREKRSVTMTAYFIMAFECNSGVKELPEDGKRHDWENYEDGPYKPQDDGLTAESCILDIDLVSEHEVRVDYVRVWDILEGEPSVVDDDDLPDVLVPDFDLDEPAEKTSIDDQIAQLADLYENAETQILKLEDENADLSRTLEDYRVSNSNLLESRAQTLRTIQRLEATERDLLVQVDTLNGKLLTPTPKQGPPVTQQSVDRLQSLLNRARNKR